MWHICKPNCFLGEIRYTFDMEYSIEQLKEIIVPILKEKGVIRSSLFGSYAHGSVTRDSDIDVLVELPDGKDLLDLVDLQFALEDRLQKKLMY